MTVRRVRAIVMLAAGLVLVAGLGLRIADARAETPLGSYTAIATAPGFEVTEDEPSAQAHPEGQGAVPFTTSLLSSGGLGYGLSTVAWPGSYGGNAGSLILVALPSQAGGVPVPDAIRDGVKTAAPALQYPIRAEARAGSAPDASYNQIPGTTLTSHADTSNAHADGSVQGATQPGAATYGNLHSESSSTINGNSVKAVATSLVQDIDIGGVVKIKSITSTATATAGSSESANGATVVQGMTVANQKVYLDDKGLQVGEPGKPDPTNATAAALVNTALEGFGMKVYVSQPFGDKAGGTNNYTAGSVIFQWIPPSNANKNVFIVTFGGARVSVAAGEGFSFEGPPEVTVPPVAGDTGGGGDTSVLPSTADNPGGSTPLDVSGTGGTGTGGAGSSRPTSLAGAQPLAATFGGIGMGWILAGLAAVVLIGVGSRRLIGDLLDNPAATCPLEVRR
jgi:hypothetical protein